MPTFAHKITPMLWFDGQAEEAARLYVSVFPDSSIGAISRQPDGTALVVEFTLAGHRFTALNGGPNYSFTPAVSFVIDCDDQEEVDHYWDKLSEGGAPEAQQCGWLADRFGVSWQVVPAAARRVPERPRPGEGGQDHAGHAHDEEAGHRGPAPRARRRGVTEAGLDAAASTTAPWGHDRPHPHPYRHADRRARRRAISAPGSPPCAARCATWPTPTCRAASAARAARRRTSCTSARRSDDALATCRASCCSRRRACRPATCCCPTTTRGRCPLLDEDGRCAIYAHRPLTCRTLRLPRVRRGRHRRRPGADHAAGAALALRLLRARGRSGAGRRPRRRALDPGARGGVSRRRRAGRSGCARRARGPGRGRLPAGRRGSGARPRPSPRRSCVGRRARRQPRGRPVDDVTADRAASRSAPGCAPRSPRSTRDVPADVPCGDLQRLLPHVPPAPHPPGGEAGAPAPAQGVPLGRAAACRRATCCSGTRGGRLPGAGRRPVHRLRGPAAGLSHVRLPDVRRYRGGA